ncbi:MAG TPA: carboxymuconolactone decarboxylase family protein [Pseudonocardia sp.]|jgi:AhpD family alkylhydroperoxidase|nr:carboxymuconolactone decarboxylase family protein [Pseudonocardia sp.]
MDAQIRTLIALGASAAANCRPCLEHHLGEARRAGLADDQIAEAIEIGIQVNEGAARQTQTFVRTLLQGELPRAASARSCC